MATEEPLSRKKTGNKILILIRHAHRDKNFAREADNGLSDKGREQARRAAKHFNEAFAGKPACFVSSPKLRCQQTLSPFVDGDESAVRVSDLLDEGRDISERVETFIRWWKKEEHSLVVACSHGDWIPICIEILTGVSMGIEKGGWVEIHLVDGKALLVKTDNG